MRVRLIERSDFDTVTELARHNMKTRPTLTFNEAKCRDILESSVAHATPTIYVCESNGKVIGAAAMDFFSHFAADGLYAVQQVLYVTPEKRGTRAAALLMRQMIEWAEGIGCTEIVGGNDNEFNSEQTAKFLGKFGFKRVGYSMRRDL